MEEISMRYIAQLAAYAGVSEDAVRCYIEAARGIEVAVTAKDAYNQACVIVETLAETPIDVPIAVADRAIDQAIFAVTYGYEGRHFSGPDSA